MPKTSKDFSLCHNVQYSAEAFPVSNLIDTRKVIHIMKTVEEKNVLSTLQCPKAGILVCGVIFKMPNNG
jgi:hypothetical protein